MLHFDKIFWPNVEFLGVVASTSYGCSYFLNLHKATGHPVLVYMPAGRLARDIEKMSDEAAAKFAFLQLKGILPDASEPVCFCFIILVCSVILIWFSSTYCLLFSILFIDSVSGITLGNG